MQRYRLFFGALVLSLGLGACATAVEDEAGSVGGEKISPNNGQSCLNHCGGASEDESCWCDPECGVRGTCCSDFAAICTPSTTAGGGSGGSGGDPSAAGAGGSGVGGSGGGVGGSGATSSGGSSGTGFGGTGSTGGTGFGGVGGGLPSGGTSGVGGSGAVAGSCVGACGGPAASGSCWCDAGCQQSGDCCGDYASACGGGGTSGGAGGGCTPQLCTSGQPGSEGGVPCYCDPSCFAYGDCCSNVLLVCAF